MRILMLVNWKVEQCKKKPIDKQPPDYYIREEGYWFFKYFHQDVEIDIIDIHSFKWIEKIEKNIFRFYIVQAIKALKVYKNYDLVISHGMQSAIFFSFCKRLFHKKRIPHIVFEIGSFSSASEKGLKLKLMQYASKSIDGYIYHTSKQLEYYKRFFPWIVRKSQFIAFGTDQYFFNHYTNRGQVQKERYILCVGYSKRDWNTLIKAYNLIKTDVKLILIGKTDLVIENKNIIIKPFLPIDQLIAYISGALFCVLPLEYMNYSYGQMTLLQQMSLGKAVITAKVPSMIDYVTDYENGILYHSGDSKDLSYKMNQLLLDNQLREKIESNAVSSIEKKYNEKVMARQIEKFINKIVV